MFRKKAKKQLDIVSPEMKAQAKRLEELKYKIECSNDRLNKEVEETRAVVAEVSDKLKAGLKKLDPSLGLFIANRDEGVAFVDFRGEIIHVNHAASELLNMPVAQMLHKRIDYILTGQKRRRISIEACSKLIIDKVKADGDCTHDELCDTARTAYLLKTEELAMHLDEPVCFVFKSGDSIHPLKVTISLLDTAPKELADITYLCKISQIAGSPAPQYHEVAKA